MASLHGTGNGGTGVFGESTNGLGVHGKCKGKNTGVFGESDGGFGVHGRSFGGVGAEPKVPGVLGISLGVGVQGESRTLADILGNDTGVFGLSAGGWGVHGKSTNSIGVHGESTNDVGVHGHCLGNDTGVFGLSKGGFGVHGNSDTSIGVHGRCLFGNAPGVLGLSADGVGVHGACRGIDDTGGNNAGVLGESKGGRGVYGHATDPKGVGVFGEGKTAGQFLGDVVVENGDVRLTGADCAEEFDVVETEIVEPGTVMVLGEEGEVRPSYKEYDKRVAGVISGAGDYRPGLVLDKQPSQRKRQPIALLGKAYCKVDAEYAPIEIGDLLTTSPTQGHAMKATDPLKAFGTVIGKALRPVMEAQNLIPVLITLQ